MPTKGTPPYPCPVVGIGASAGGLDALLRLFAALPSKTNLAFVIVQHLDPTHQSQAALILSRSTDMPVREIKDKMHLEPNHVYVIPSNFILSISSDILNLLPRPQGHQRAIDFFFESLAQSKKTEAIGIILSGTGFDGTAGLASIKAEGGLTFVQDPDSAKYDAMPRSAIKSGVADFVLNPENIAKELARSGNFNEGGTQRSLSELESDSSNRELSEDAIQRIFSLIRDRTLIDFSSYKISTVKRRIQRQMRVHKQESIVCYAGYLESHPEAVVSLYEDMFIHVTEFFRDPDSFLSLRTSVFPHLLRNKTLGIPIRIWVPGCSTGEEAYSLVISLLEFLGVQAQKAIIQLFATDISERAIQTARAGFYSEHQIRGVSQDRLKKFFDVVKDGYKVKKEIRDLCVFSRHDVANNPPFAKVDLISCRNVLIYFAPVLQKKVMPIFHYALNPERFLWLGKSEAPSGFSKLFTLVDKTNKIYTKLNVPSPMNFRFPTGRHLSEQPESTKKETNYPAAVIGALKEFDRFATSRYVPTGIIINNDLEIIQVRGRTGNFLEFPSGQPNFNLLKSLRPELLASVRMAVQSAMKQNSIVRKEGVTYQHGNRRKKVNIEVAPANPVTSQKERQFFIFFEEDSGATKKKSLTKVQSRKKSSAKKNVDAREAYIAQLLEELDATREYQQSLAEGYEAAQEELTSANEELQSTNEELQSTNEEMETAKEELQAANEELSTINDELQNRNEELSSLNEELARSEERFRLMVEGVKDYAIFMLDADGNIETWNEGARRLKGYDPSEIIGKHFSIFHGEEDKSKGKPWWELKEATKVGRVEDEGWRIRKDGSKFWANVNITRMNDENGNLLGFSNVTRDLTERKNAEDELRRSELRARLMVQEVKDYAIFMLDPAGRVATWNEGAKRIKQYDSTEIVGQHFSKFYTPEDIKAGKPQKELELVKNQGRIEDEGWRIRKDGSRFWANVIITRINDENGDFLGFSKVTRDLTERKASEDALRKANENLEIRVKERTSDLEAAKDRLIEALLFRDEFLSIASHELKTPLTSLKLQLQIAQRRKETLNSTQISKVFEMGIKQVNSLTKLVDDLLDVSKIQTGKFSMNCENLNLSELIREVASRFTEQLSSAHISIELRLEEHLIGFWDRQRMEQVITNLVSNAIKYAPCTPLVITSTRVEDQAILIVEDSGPGIKKEQQEKIFERFERGGQSTSIGGLGLGLFIVRRIVEIHQGSISVESEPGRGSKFVVKLPFNSCLGDKVVVT